MAKIMTFGGMAVAGLIVLAFGLDLALGIPFGGASLLTNLGFVFSGGVLGYLSWNTFREL